MKTAGNALQWEKVHVFISSTFNDMHADRDYLVKRVFPELQDWCERRKLRLVDIDLRWGVTEQDATHNRNVVKVCLNRIDDCRPFFLCFLGQRRGWVPKASEISAETFAAFPDLRPVVGAASVTEMEILHALINPLHRSLPRQAAKPAEYYEPAKYAFFYLRDPSYLDQLPEAPPMRRETYTNEGIEDAAERAAHDLALKKCREVDIPRSGRPYHSYEANWNANAVTPELMLPLQCPSSEPANIERWQRQWQKAGVSATGLNIEDDALAASKARAFNRRLSAGRLADFQCEEARLSRVIIQELQEAIATRYPDHSEVEREDELQKEIDQQEQFLFTASEGFIEREGDFAELDDYVEGDSNQLFVVTAAGGMGKTTLLANWVERYRRRLADRADHSIHFRFIGQSDGTATVYSLLRLLLREIKEAAQKIDDEIPLDPIKLRNEWPALLEAIGKRGPTVIVIDALNQLDSDLTNVGWLPRQLPDHIKLIVSFKRGDALAEQLYERFSAGNQIRLSEVKPFANLDDRRRLVRAYLSQYLKELDEPHLETLINLRGAENPLYLKVVLSELRVFGAYGNLAAKIHEDFGDTPVSAFVRVLDRLENDPAYSPIDPKRAVPLLFGLLAHVRRGLSVDELTSLFIQALELDDTEPWREAATDTVNLFLREVRSFLARREGRYDFFFESFKTAVQQCYVTRSNEKTISKRSYQEWHRLLATYFVSLPTWHKAASSSEAEPGRQPTRRKVAELPHHLIQAERWEGVEDTLCDLDFIEAKCSTGMLFDLLRDCDRAMQVHDLAGVAQVRRALALALPSLSQHPALVLQTIYNRLIWFERLAPLLQTRVGKTRSLLDRRQFWIHAEAPLPGSQTQATVSVPFEIESSIQSTSLAPLTIAIASVHGTVEVRSLPHGELIDRRRLATSRVAAIALLEGSDQLAYMDMDGVIRLENDSIPFTGRRGEKLLAYHHRYGIMAVRSDHALVAWRSDQAAVELMATDLPSPLVSLKISPDGGSVLYVAGFKNQLVGLATRTGEGWVTQALPHVGPPVVDVDLDNEARHVLLVSTNRRLSIFSTKTGELLPPIFYERRNDETVRGAPLKCALGIGDSLGWAFVATRAGHIAGWNWIQDKLERLEDYRGINQTTNLVQFQILQSTGELLFSTDTQAKTISRECRHKRPIGHSAMVTECLLTPSNQIVSASEVDKTVCWFSAAGLKPLAQQVLGQHQPMTMSRQESTGDVIVGTREGTIWRVSSNGEVCDKNMPRAFAEPVVSLFLSGNDKLLAAGLSGRVLSIGLPPNRVDVLWHSTGFQKQKKILPAGRQGLYWSIYENDAAGQKSAIVSLVRDVNKEDVAFSTEQEIITDVAVSRDGKTICIAGNSLRVLRQSGADWVTRYYKEIPVNRVAFLGEDEDLIVVALRHQDWLEIRSLTEGLPTVAEIELPERLSCLSAMGNRIIAGFFSGSLMSIRLQTGSHSESVVSRQEKGGLTHETL